MFNTLNSKKRTIRVFPLLGYNQDNLKDLERRSSGVFGDMIRGDNSDLLQFSVVPDDTGFHEYILIGGKDWRRSIMLLEDKGFEIGPQVQTIRTISGLKELQERLYHNKWSTPISQKLKKIFGCSLGALLFGLSVFNEIYQPRHQEVVFYHSEDSTGAYQSNDSLRFQKSIERYFLDHDTLHNLDD